MTAPDRPDRPEQVVVRDADGYPITPAVIMAAYWQRMFPMAETRRGRFRWYRPEVRAVLTWDRYKIPESLRKTMRHEPYRLTIDAAFPRVIEACAERDSTWISLGIERLYIALHQLGIAHSVEAWQGDELVGGLYGLCLGSCFCGESMFHRADNASKLCLVHLVSHLQARGFDLLDSQQQTPHMSRFGTFEITDADYAKRLEGCRRECPW